MKFTSRTFLGQLLLKDSTIVFKQQSILLWSEELKVVSHCLDSIASKASLTLRWTGHTLTRMGMIHFGIVVRKQQMFPKDWWVEDLCELQIDLQKCVMTTIKTKGKVSDLDSCEREDEGKEMETWTKERVLARPNIKFGVFCFFVFCFFF